MKVEDRSGIPRNLSHIKYITEQNQIDRDDLLLNGILVENLHELSLEGTLPPDHRTFKCWETAARILKPAFDTVWNAAGFDRSLHYNSEGKWTGGIEW